ncbi:hypothetical protein INT47_010863 [Mucor saturninus]|uniref:F-box domain-containing protein n=1 Tax=Mucor saturninus TaxID=64648 RepID=A0A8H7VB29_9FUNG|nr:hypothetical protein INT47_010863 [Mucor saturninus]
MSKSLPGNHRFPIEILQQILDKLESNVELKTCLLVCKTWHSVAQGFFSADIRLSIDDMSLKRLLKDLPAFGYKVKKLTLNYLSSGTESAVTLRSVLKMCPNLLQLQFDFTEVYEYLKALNCHGAVLPSIQHIRVLDLKGCSPAVRRFHLWVNYRFRASITSLEIDDLEDNGALKNYGGLIHLVSMFPNLTYLRAKCHSIVDRDLCVNLTELLSAGPKLQELKLYGIGEISHQKDLVIDYPKITKLKLKVAQMDIQFLQYIVTSFKNVNNLRLITFNILPDNSLTNQASDKVLRDLDSYTVGMSRVNINYKYKATSHISNRGKVNPNKIVMMGLPDGFILREQGWMVGDWLDDDDDDDEEDNDYFYAEEEEEEEEDFGSADYITDMRLAHMLYQHLLDRIEAEEDDGDEIPMHPSEEEELMRAYYSF